MRPSLLQAALASVLLLGSCSKPAVPRAQPNESVSPAPSPPAAPAAPTCPGDPDPSNAHLKLAVPPSFSLKLNAAKLEQIVSRAGAAEGWRVIASSDGLGAQPMPFVNGWQRQRELRSIVSVDCSADRTEQTANAGSAVYVGKDCNVFAVVQPGNGKCPGVPKDSEALLRAILTQKL